MDGSPEIGLGHLIRCLALAQMLDQLFEIIFVCKKISPDFTYQVKSLSYKLVLIVDEKEFIDQLDKDDLVVLDHYGLDSSYQVKVKALGCKLICIDDVPDKIFYADLIINHAPNINASTYKAQAYTLFALGLDYVLLRPVFFELANSIRVQKKISSAFVCFGGSDSENLTIKTVEILKLDLRFRKVNIVVGSSYKEIDYLKSILVGDDRFKLYSSIGAEQIANLILQSDLAIVPASGILQEALILGCQVISGMYVENQIYIYENYKKLGAFESANNFSKESIETAINKKFEAAGASYKALIDGKSPTRLLSLFKQLAEQDKVALRDITKDDLFKTYHWATNNIIRSFSYSKHKINFEEHSAWFLQKAESKTCFYFIAAIDGNDIGSIRFDINNNEAIISYLLDPEYHNRGLGVSLLKLGLERLLTKNITKLKQVVGYVMPENIASAKAFEKLGFVKEIENDNFKFVKNI